MIPSLSELLGLGERELVALVGAGGKSTLLLGLGTELAAVGRRVVLTTTTKLQPDQVTGTACRSTDPEAVAACFSSSDGPVFVIGEQDGRKVIGPSSEEVDRLYAEAPVDYLLVEADGARRRSFKAPADHEPVIPATATLVVVVASLAAIGRPLVEAAHRPERVSALTGLDMEAVVGPEHIAAVLGHPNGGLKGVPDRARAVVALTGIESGEREEAADLIRRRLEPNPRVDRIVLIPSFN